MKLLLALCCTLAWPLAAPARSGLTTTWSVGNGDWSDGAGWSNGEPTAAHRAEIGSNATVQISQNGEACLDLVLGAGSQNGGVSMTGGDLTIANAIEAGDTAFGSYQQFGGMVAAPQLTIAGGTYIQVAGTFTGDACAVGIGARTGTLSVSGSGSFTVTGDIAVSLGSTVTIGGGAFSAGTTPSHVVTVAGGLGLTTPGTGATMQNLTFAGDSAFLQVTAGSGGPGTVDVIGTATLDGSFTVSDDGVPEGRYDVITAATIAGAFDVVNLPLEGDWSWGVESTTLWIRKGAEIPVHVTTWSAVKDTFSR